MTDTPVINPPTVTINPPYVSGYTMETTQIYVFPITLTSNANLTFFLRHTSLHREDFSIQAWFSHQPATQVIFYPNTPTYSVSILKRRTRSFSIQDRAYTGSMVFPNPSTNILYLPTGNYFFNLENRVNYSNKFDVIFQQTELT